MLLRCVPIFGTLKKQNPETEAGDETRTRDLLITNQITNNQQNPCTAIVSRVLLIYSQFLVQRFYGLIGVICG